MKPSTQHAPVRIYSFVGGGPSSRLCHALRQRGHDAREISLFSLPQWRRLSSGGNLLRAAAKLSGYSLFPLLAVLDGLRSPKGVLLATSNPFFLPGLLSSSQKWQGKPVAVWLYDWLPTVAAAALPAAQDPPLSSLIKKFAARQVRSADAVVFVGQGMAALVRSETRLRRSVVLETGAQVGEFKQNSTTKRPKNAPLLVSYVGNLGRMHESLTLAQGIAAWPEQQALRFVLSLSGFHASALRKSLHARGDVEFLPALDDSAWAGLLQQTDIALVSLKKEAWQTPIPSKTFSAMAAGCAILAVAPAQSDLAKMVKQSGCGLVIEPGVVQGFTAALSQCASDKKWLRARQKASLTWLQKHYAMSHIAEGWGALCDELWAE